MSVYAMYPPQVSRNLMTLIGSHDTPRFLTLCKGDAALVRLAATVQLGWPGAPMVYYGDELGMTGGADPMNRKGMAWPTANAGNGMLPFLQADDRRPQRQRGAPVGRSVRPEWPTTPNGPSPSPAPWATTPPPSPSTGAPRPRRFPSRFPPALRGEGSPRRPDRTALRRRHDPIPGSRTEDGRGSRPGRWPQSCLQIPLLRKAPMKKAFTLIELLVVIAIIAILAAILFPVFAQAKNAAKKTADLSNLKQNMTATLIYSNDSDDILPPSREYEPYVFAARVLPYTKSRALFRNPASSSPEGTIQRKQAANGGPYITDPSYACVGLGPSTKTVKEYYNDVYPPLDYEVNKFIFGYINGVCDNGNGSFETGPDATSGSANTQGVTGVGPDYGRMELYKPLKGGPLVRFPDLGSPVPWQQPRPVLGRGVQRLLQRSFERRAHGRARPELRDESAPTGPQRRRDGLQQLQHCGRGF